MHEGSTEYIGWDRHSAILADVFDAIQANTHALVMANTDKKHKNDVKDPDPYPRPGGVEKKQKRKGSNSFAAMAKAQLQGG